MRDDTIPPNEPWSDDRVLFWSTDYIRAPRPRVYEHLTRGEHTRAYYFGMPISDPRAVGDPVWFGPDEDGSPIVGTVTEHEPPHRFAHTFRFRHQDDPPSHVRFTLTELGDDLTRLDTVHWGFADRASGTYQDICGGWPAILSGLKTLLETGETIRWPEPDPDDQGRA